MICKLGMSFSKHVQKYCILNFAVMASYLRQIFPYANYFHSFFKLKKKFNVRKGTSARTISLQMSIIGWYDTV